VAEAAQAQAAKDSAAKDATDAKANVDAAQETLKLVMDKGNRLRRADDELPTLEEAAKAVADATAAQKAADKNLADAQKVADNKQAAQEKAAMDLARKEALASTAAAEATAKEAARADAQKAAAAQAKDAAAQTTTATSPQAVDSDYSEYTFYVALVLLVAFVAKVVLIDVMGLFGPAPANKEAYSLPAAELNERSGALFRETSLGPRSISVRSNGSNGSLPPDGAPTTADSSRATAWGADEYMGVGGQAQSPGYQPPAAWSESSANAVAPARRESARV